MTSVNNHYRFLIARAGRDLLEYTVMGLLLVCILPLHLNGQVPDQLRADGEESLFAMSQTGQWLQTPAEPAEFINIQGAELSRIVTLHRQTAATPATITLINLNSDFKVGTWEAVLEAVPGKDSLFYWMVYPDKAIHPGRYQVIVSDPASWVNTAGTNRQGLVWVFSHKQVSM